MESRQGTRRTKWGAGLMALAPRDIAAAFAVVIVGVPVLTLVDAIIRGLA